jgi:hypothetical protein
LVTEGGACAAAPDTESSSPKANKSACFIIEAKRPPRTLVPRPQ